MLLFDIKKIQGGKLNSEEDIIITKRKIEELLKQIGYKMEKVENIPYLYIKNEIEYRNDNYEDFKFTKELSEFQIAEVAERISNMEEMFSDVLDTIDDEIRIELKKDLAQN